MSQTWTAQQDGDIGQAFEQVSQLDVPSSSLERRQTLVNIVHAWTKRNQGGVILMNQDSTTVLAIEFFGPGKSGRGLPLVNVQFVAANALQNAQSFLRGESYETMQCRDAVFRGIVEHLQMSSLGRGHIDVASGCQIYEGVIAPIRAGTLTANNNNNTNKGTAVPVKGLNAMLGCTYEALALFRISLGLLLVLELCSRFRFVHPFYSNEGTLPLYLLMDKVDDIYKTVCFHCHFGEVWQQAIILGCQVLLAILYTIGWKTKFTSILSWYLYFSLTLRNTWMNYILDRYFHHLLFLSMFLPLDECWSVSAPRIRRYNLVVSPGTIAFKALVFWIYLDAGWGKYVDPLGGWSYNADPLPALDTYARHTVPAQYMYALLGPEGLRVMTPIVVYVELFAAPVALLGAYIGSRGLIITAASLICQLHVGIAITLRNAALLSFVACSAWAAFLPVGWNNVRSIHPKTSSSMAQKAGTLVSIILIGSMVAGNCWLETISNACDQSVKHIWSTLLHNRWNVFVGAEEYVTWEIAPGMLQDGSIVDVWGRRNEVNWNLPGGGAPCTATARPGRWRSYPYLAGLEGEDADVLWGYLCKEWDRENEADKNPGRKLLKFNFFMLQADVLPEMRFSATRKRLITSYDCVPFNTTSIDDALNEYEDQSDSNIDNSPEQRNEDEVVESATAKENTEKTVDIDGNIEEDLGEAQAEAGSAEPVTLNEEPVKPVEDAQEVNPTIEYNTNNQEALTQGEANQQQENYSDGQHEYNHQAAETVKEDSIENPPQYDRKELISEETTEKIEREKVLLEQEVDEENEELQDSQSMGNQIPETHGQGSGSHDGEL